MQRERKLKVGVAQVDSVLGDLDKNVDTHKRFIREARQAGVELLLFPELSLTGYCVGDRTVELALDRDHPLIHELAEEAGDIWAVFGFIEEGVAAQFHNSAIAVHQGRVAFIHRKLNLATYGELEEGKHFAEGRYFETFEVHKPWRAGVLICADSWNPALVDLANMHGMTLFLNPVASAQGAVGGQFSNPAGWRTAVDFYAMIYGVPTGFANFAGSERGAKFWGGSRIVDSYGSTLIEAGAEECFVQAELDYEDVKRARYRLPTLRDSNLDLVLRELNRLSWRIGIPEESRKL
jgi:predicted amidohydrolase